METFPTRLSVNVNKIATLRNARGAARPCPVAAAVRIQQWGADGITVHPRPDGRHITFDDVRKLKPVITTEFNIEGYPSSEFVDLVLEIAPDQVTLVPDPPGILTSNEGWDTRIHAEMLGQVLSKFREAGIRTSLFISTDHSLIQGAADVGADRIELYTGPYAAAFSQDPSAAVRPFAAAAEHAANVGLDVNAGHDLDLDNLAHLGADRIELYTGPYAAAFPQDPSAAVRPFAAAAEHAANVGLDVNAGHDLDLDNLAHFAQHVQPLHEVSIGHALISDALYVGLQNAVGQYKAQLRPA